jgi:hypothetical protein
LGPWPHGCRDPNVIDGHDFYLRNLGVDLDALQIRSLAGLGIEGQEILVVQNRLEPVEVRLEADSVLDSQEERLAAGLIRRLRPSMPSEIARTSHLILLSGQPLNWPINTGKDCRKRPYSPEANALSWRPRHGRW